MNKCPDPGILNISLQFKHHNRKHLMQGRGCTFDEIYCLFGIVIVVVV
jgi:hypothetical protein